MNKIDIGFNGTSHQFQNDIDQVFDKSRSLGIGLIWTGTSMKCNRILVQKSMKKYPDAWCTIGVHPHEAKTFTDKTPGEMRELISAGGKQVVAVGECGLDYYRNLSPPVQQQKAFIAQIQLALELDLPLFLHIRQAYADFFQIIETEFSKAGKRVPGVVHCFTGTPTEARQCIDHGFYLGFTGFICMPERGRRVREQVLKEVPIDKLMIETDAPFMHPSGKRERCEPHHLNQVLQTMATARGANVKTLRKQILKNTQNFFQI